MTGELVADIKIDGKDGPIPKIIKARDVKTNVFVDDGSKITKHKASREEAKSLAGLKMSDGTTLAQIENVELPTKADLAQVEEVSITKKPELNFSPKLNPEAADTIKENT